MRFNPDKCPECGAEIKATCDMVPANALVERDPATGEYEYTGESKMCWDAQYTENEDDGLLVICETGHQFVATCNEEEGR